MKYWFHILKNSNSSGTILLLTFFITIMGLLSPIFIIHIFNRYIAFGLQGTLIFLLSGALAVAIFEFIFRNIRNNILSNILINPIKTFKLDLIKTFFERENRKKKSNFTDIIDFNNNFFQFISPKIQSSLLDAFFIIFIIIILFFLDFFLATIFLILVIFFLILQQKLIRNKNNILRNQNLLNNDKLIIRELRVNEELLKSTFAIKYAGFYIDNFLEKKLAVDSSIARNEAQQISTTSFFILISSIFTIGIGSMLVVNGNLSIGSLIGFNIFATRALGTISSVQNSLSILQKTNFYLKDCKDFFEKSKNRSEGMQLSKLIGNITINDVSYIFNNDSKYILKNLTAKFKSSEISVVSGNNGTGKTTLAKLLVGLYNAESGEILIDDTNLDKLSLVWFKQNIVYIPQEVDILNSSVLNNILISNPNLNQQEVSRLLQNVGLDKELKNSNLTITDPINNDISKGILKKIHIARSISRNFQIYVFDDPTIYLDSNGRKMIVKLITSLKRAGKTLICFSEDEEILKLSDNRVILGE
jgi:ATP-binding cassette subfamily C protein LapB